MTRRQWSLVILMILINYLVFSQLFQRIMDSPGQFASATRTPDVTFTPTPLLDVPVVVPPTATARPAPGTPTATNTRVILSEEQARAATITVRAEQTEQAAAAEQTRIVEQAQAGTPLPPAVPTETPTPAQADDTTPRVTASNSTVNLRAGPGTNYQAVGSLPLGQSLNIIGRNANSSWWQVATTDGPRWIAASVTTATNTGDNIPVVQGPSPPTQPPPPPATPTPPPAQPTAPPQPQQQYTIRNIFGQVNEAITQIRGDIRDGGDNPVNGIRIRVRSGAFCTISYPSGPPGGYPNGVYDILLDSRAKDGQWQVAVVNGPADPTDTQCSDSLAVLSEEVTVPTNSLEGVVFVEWRKNF